MNRLEEILENPFTPNTEMNLDGVNDLLASWLAVKEKQLDYKLSHILKILGQYRSIEDFIGSYCLITGSKAKTHYGFDLYPPSKKVGNQEIRDTDYILKPRYLKLLGDSVILNQHKLELRYFFQTIKILEEYTKDVTIAWGGENSSVPCNIKDVTPTEFAICRFYWQGQMYEIFLCQEDTYPDNSVVYVSLENLVTTAKKWDRPKDKHFITQVEDRIDYYKRLEKKMNVGQPIQQTAQPVRVFHEDIFGVPKNNDEQSE